MRLKLLVLVAVVLQVKAKNCEFGWANFRDSCYLHVGYPTIDPLSFHEAQSACYSKGAYLVDLQDQQETDFVVALGKKASSAPLMTFPNGQPWIGLVLHGDVWKWEPSMRVATYLPPWMPTQPQDEQCVRLNVDFEGIGVVSTTNVTIQTIPGEIEDWPCDEGVTRFICKKEAMI